MALHTDAAAHTRLVTYDKNVCPQCSFMAASSRLVRTSE